MSNILNKNQGLLLILAAILFTSCPPTRPASFTFKNPLIIVFKGNLQEWNEKFDQYAIASNIKIDGIPPSDNRPQYYLGNIGIAAVAIDSPYIFCQAVNSLYFEHHEKRNTRAGKFLFNRKVKQLKENLATKAASYIYGDGHFPNDLKVDTLSLTSHYFGAKEQLHFKDNILHGLYQRWHPNGQIQIEGQYKTGMEIGDWMYYDSLGQVKEKAFFKEGILSSSTIYHPDGNTTTTKTPSFAKLFITHLLSLLILFFILIKTIGFYKRNYGLSRRTIFEWRNPIARFLAHGILSFLNAIVSIFLLAFMLLGLVTILLAIGHDLPIDISSVFASFYIMFLVFLLYYIFTQRYKDNVWLCFWATLSYYIIGEIIFLFSLWAYPSLF